MPYITEKARQSDHMLSYEPHTAGELNFIITTFIRDYYLANPCYQSVNDIVGALEGAKLEFYRRIAAPYEDSKIMENGDVYF
jgi:hypothetical protein